MRVVMSAPLRSTLRAPRTRHTTRRVRSSWCETSGAPIRTVDQGWRAPDEHATRFG
jgi:hypothetical protein